MYKNTYLGKVQVKIPTYGSQQPPGHFTVENELNVPRI